jgi:transposase InsO family protein
VSAGTALEVLTVRCCAHAMVLVLFAVLTVCVILWTLRATAARAMGVQRASWPALLQMQLPLSHALGMESAMRQTRPASALRALWASRVSRSAAMCVSTDIASRRSHCWHRMSANAFDPLRLVTGLAETAACVLTRSLDLDARCRVPWTASTALRAEAEAAALLLLMVG